MSKNPIQTAIILAAGQGSKFWPYNIVRQKAAFPIANVPAVRRIVDDLIQLGITRIVVVTGPGEKSVRAALHGVNQPIIYARQPQPDGTADAALVGANALEEDLLVIAGDLVTARQNLSVLITGFNQHRPLAAALIQPLDQELPQSWLVAFPEGNKLRAVEGHSRDGSYRLGGMYMFRATALRYLRNNPGVMSQVPVGGMPPLEAEIAQSIQMMIDDGESVLAVETEGYHIDLDKPWHILEANKQVIDAMSVTIEADIVPTSCRIHDGAEIHGRLVMGENSEIGNRVVVKGDLWLGSGASVTNGAILDGPVIIGSKTRVRDYCHIGGGSSLGAQGIYGHGAEFGGVALDKVYCYHYCEIAGVVGMAVDFGAATVCGNLRFDDRETVWQVKGQAEVPVLGANLAYFGDFSRTGVNAIIMPGCRIGVNSCLGPGVIIYEDVADRRLILAKQELEIKPWGPERYGW